jgi:hypothetical protein
MKTASCLRSGVLLWCLVSAAAVAATDSPWQENRLLPLEKITVGPWDNLEVTVTKDDSVVYFTRARTQIPNVYRQDLGSDEASLWVGEEGDAKDPSLDPAGQWLAFTYYRFDAQGDVCLANVADKNIRCLTTAQTVDESPFWIDGQHVGFLSRDTGRAQWDLVSYDLQTQERRVLHSGALSAPAASPDGAYILFNETAQNGEVRVHAWQRQSGAEQVLSSFDLPGITGYMSFSADGRDVYFNHYLSDTNFDQVIDANDHSVAFRVSFAQWLTGGAALLPEQLTSVADNCKFPAVTGQFIYLTCAFEGSLDIYRLPLTGSVPANWDEGRLWEAHRIARSYEERLLLLNTLRYRFQRDEIALLERLLSNHLEIGEFTAASYYVEQLTERARAAADGQMQQFYAALAQLLRVQSQKQRVPVGVVTARFERLVADARQQLEAAAAWPRLLTLINGYLDFELEDYAQADERVTQIDLAQPMLPLERYLAFELYRRLHEERDLPGLMRAYPLMFNASDVPLEARLYYAFNYLRVVSRLYGSLSERSAEVQAQAGLASEPKVAELLRAEVFSLQLAASADSQQQGAAFKQLLEQLKRNRDDVLLRKLMHTRAIYLLGEAERFESMELLSRNWLTITQTGEMEFANVAEQYAVITMDKAYGLMAEGERAKAYGVFYSAIRQTDDLEAHFQFITLGLTPDLELRANLDQSYQLLETQQLLGQSRNYAAALRRVIDSEKTGEKRDEARTQALALLEPMRAQGLSPAMRELLMGYVYHLRLRDGAQAYRYDKAAFQKAHHHYMMALDMARDNGRITAAVLENLSTLHFDVRNYALSAGFLQERLALPFISAETQALLRWRFARVLFYNDEFAAAADQAQRALALARQTPSLDTLAFVEKAAFYALQAKQLDVAVAGYAELLSATSQLSDHNRAKALLAQGYALLQQGEKASARESLLAVLELTSKLAALPADAQRLLPLRPERLRLLAYGFLANLDEQAAQRISYRRQRIALLQSLAGKQVQDFGYDESARLSLLTKDFHHLALDNEAAGEFDEMAKALQAAFTTAVAWASASGDVIGPVMYRTLVNGLVLGIQHPAAIDQTTARQWLSRTQDAVRTFEQLPDQTATTLAQRAKLLLLVEAYRTRVLAEAEQTLAQRLSNVIETPAARSLRERAPEAFQELDDMASALR